MNIYLNVLTWRTSALHRPLVHSPTKGHRCDSWTKVFLISLAPGRCPEGSPSLNTSSCGLNSSQSKCHSLVVIRTCPNRMNSTTIMRRPVLSACAHCGSVRQAVVICARSSGVTNGLEVTSRDLGALWSSPTPSKQPSLIRREVRPSLTSLPWLHCAKQMPRAMGPGRGEPTSLTE